jgi:hypothetical protein
MSFGRKNIKSGKIKKRQIEEKGEKTEEKGKIKVKKGEINAHKEK